MRALITARWDVGTIAAIMGVEEDSDGEFYIEIPNDTLSFLELVTKHELGRFEVRKPSENRDAWMLYFHNDYD